MYDKGAVVNFDLILPSIPGDINDRNSWVGKVLFCLEDKFEMEYFSGGERCIFRIVKEK